MPELPEVETTVCGIKPHILNKKITHVIIRQYQLRWPIPRQLKQYLVGQTVYHISRRAKYILLHIETGTLIIHLGMSGHLRILPKDTPLHKHDHVDIEFNHQVLRFNDPRRFGAILWTSDPLENHPILQNLGVEPLDRYFSGHYLWQCTQKRKIPIKSLIMQNHVVVGIGNIYAAESLFLSKIHPLTLANTLTQAQCITLVTAIKAILRKAIRNGGTTLKDFLSSEGKPGYFANHLKVYGRATLPCLECQLPLELIRIGQRSTVFCPNCQTRL